MIKTGPRGGKYYMTSGGKKQYLKYEKEQLPDSSFCGPAGGYPPGTYPVDTKERCSSALRYARHAPNPCGIAKCVQKKCPEGTGKSSKLFVECDIKIPPSSDNVVSFYNYRVKSDARDYLTKKVLDIKESTLRNRGKNLIYFPMSRLPDEKSLKNFIVDEILDMARYHSRDNYGSDIITLKGVKTVILNDAELKYLVK